MRGGHLRTVRCERLGDPTSSWHQPQQLSRNYINLGRAQRPLSHRRFHTCEGARGALRNRLVRHERAYFGISVGVGDGRPQGCV